MTAGPAVTGAVMPGTAADGLIDLGTIRRCDAILDLLAGRRLDMAVARRDPALATLSVLTADVDGAGSRLAAGGRRAAGPPRVTAAAIVASALAALILAVVAAGTTGIVVASLLARVARLGTGLPAGFPERGRHAARHRRR